MKKILLIVSGGIAAYRALDLIREIKRRGDDVTCVLTKSATQFVQPLSFGALSQTKVYTDLFDLESETNIGHIKLSRNSDLVVLAPATANILAKMISVHETDSENILYKYKNGRLENWKNLDIKSQSILKTKTKKVNTILMELSAVEYLTNLRI